GPKTVSAGNDGRLDSLLATRLENALVLAGKGKVGITRQAGQTAMRKLGKDIDYKDAAGRKKLLTLSYQMCAGEDRKLDAFLTGTIRVAPNFKKIPVVIRAWDKSLTPQEVTTFEARTDRAALIEMNRSFVVKRATLLSLVKQRSDMDDAA